MKTNLDATKKLDLECAVFESMMSRPGADEDSVNATLAWMRSDTSIMLAYLADAHDTVSVNFSLTL